MPSNLLQTNRLCLRDLLPRTRSAFSLVEVVLAIAIVSFGIIAIFGLLPSGLQMVKEARLREQATEILALAATDLRNTPKSVASSAFPASPIFGLRPYAPSSVSTGIDLNSLGVPTPTNEATLRLRVTPRAGANPNLAVWYLAVEWPPQAQAPSSRVETVVVLRR